MRKFNEVIEDVKAPNTQSLWLNEGSLSYYGKNGWESISSDDIKNAITDINNALSEEISTRQENDTILINAIKNAFNDGYLFAGVATPSTNPGTPNGKVFYIANGKGIYTNFGGLEVTDDDDFAIFTYDNAWAKSNVAISSSGGIAETMVETTYAEVKSMRDNGTLTPGMWYRITDYKCTTNQSDTISAGNKFDVIVLATSANTLSEQARAINHTPQEGETDYFANSNLSAWQIWYCLDNDTTRFAWANSTIGKGVIYRMIDEWNNDIPYDFKNIKFRHPNNRTDSRYYYTFASDKVENNTDLSLSISGKCYLNKISAYITSDKYTLNQIIFIGNNCYSNSFGSNCYNNSFENDCYNNSFENNCFSNSFSRGCYNNSLGTNCYRNSLGGNCEFNSFGNYCHDNSIENRGEYISFGNYCSNIDLDSAYGYYNNHFGDICKYIVLKNLNTGSANTEVQNYNFAQGLQGTPSSFIIVNGDSKRAYETKVAKNSSGELKIYCEADLVQ